MRSYQSLDYSPMDVQADKEETLHHNTLYNNFGVGPGFETDTAKQQLAQPTAAKTLTPQQLLTLQQQQALLKQRALQQQQQQIRMQTLNLTADQIRQQQLKQIQGRTVAGQTVITQQLVTSIGGIVPKQTQVKAAATLPRQLRKEDLAPVKKPRLAQKTQTKETLTIGMQQNTMAENQLTGYNLPDAEQHGHYTNTDNPHTEENIHDVDPSLSTNLALREQNQIQAVAKTDTAQQQLAQPTAAKTLTPQQLLTLQQQQALLKQRALQQQQQQIRMQKLNLTADQIRQQQLKQIQGRIVAGQKVITQQLVTSIGGIVPKQTQVKAAATLPPQLRNEDLVLLKQQLLAQKTQTKETLTIGMQQNTMAENQLTGYNLPDGQQHGHHTNTDNPHTEENIHDVDPSLSTNLALREQNQSQAVAKRVQKPDSSESEENDDIDS